MKHTCPDCQCPSDELCEGPHCTHGAGDGTEFCCRCEYRYSLEAGWVSGNDSVSYPPPGCKLRLLVT
jgi:hypothetical protein